MVRVERVSGEHEDFRELIRYLDIDLNSRYGALQEGYDQFNKMENISTAVVGYSWNKPVGCGCFRPLNEDSAEIKRMYVLPDFRGKGLAAMILYELEQWASEKGFRKAVLETGIKNYEALRFYPKLGYSTIDNYGPYIGNANSICMSKKLES